jgi:protein phosphatase methylesterase 1
MRGFHHIISVDLRGHGSTVTENDSDLSVLTIQNDLISILKHFNDSKTQFFVIGHSFGGAMAIHTTFHIQRNVTEIHIGGIIVLDVVEGTAMQSLTHMREVVHKRKSVFTSIPEAIQYNVQSGFLRNLSSACVSVPSQLILKDNMYTWRTDLGDSQKYWSEWYSGISNKFIAIKGPKLLIVAGTDRLDNTLTMAHMQGKFQLKLIEGGHFLNEDEPKKLCDIVLEFVKKFEFYNYNHK